MLSLLPFLKPKILKNHLDSTSCRARLVRYRFFLFNLDPIPGFRADTNLKIIREASYMLVQVWSDDSVKQDYDLCNICVLFSNFLTHNMCVRVKCLCLRLFTHGTDLGFHIPHGIITSCIILTPGSPILLSIWQFKDVGLSQTLIGHSKH